MSEDRVTGGIDEIVGRIKTKDDWSFFDDMLLPQQALDQIKAATERQKEKQRKIARAWADFYETPGGRAALQQLFDATLNTQVYLTGMGLGADQVGIYGATREGQNKIADIIAQMIAAGLGQPAKRRDAK